jgi:hypothetical protein
VVILETVLVPDSRAIVLRRLHAEYEALGTERQRVDAKHHHSISAGTMRSPITVDEVRYKAEEVMAMDNQERARLADAFLEQYGQLDDYRAFEALRQQWLSDPRHDSYEWFILWREAIRSYPGGVTAYWADLIQVNEPARALRESLRVVGAAAGGEEAEAILSSLVAYMHAKGIQASAYDRPSAPSQSVRDPLGILDEAGA